MRRAQSRSMQDVALNGEARARGVWPGLGLLEVVLRQKQKCLPSNQYHSSISKGTRRPEALLKP